MPRLSAQALFALALVAASLIPAAAQPALLYDGADGAEAAQRLAASLGRQDSVRVGSVIEGVVTAEWLRDGHAPLALLVRPLVTDSDTLDEVELYVEAEPAPEVPDVAGALEAVRRRAALRAHCATRTLTARKPEATGRADVVANPLGGLAYRRVLLFRDTLAWAPLRRAIAELPGRVERAREALAGCTGRADPMQTEVAAEALDRARYRVVLFADTTVDLAPAVRRLTGAGYAAPVLRDAPTAPPSIKYGSAPTTVVSEVLAAIADALGVSTLDFQRQPAFAPDDPDIFVNLPGALVEQARPASGAGAPPADTTAQR